MFPSFFNMYMDGVVRKVTVRMMEIERLKKGMGIRVWEVNQLMFINDAEFDCKLENLSSLVRVCNV